MAKQTIGIGTVANDGTGDPIRDAFDKCNDNFDELYTAVTGLLELKGSTDCSANPNYPAASKGDTYVVSVAGKIGGASGTDVEVGDVYFANADNAGGDQATVGASWNIIQGNILAGSVSDLDDLSDVDLTGLADGDTLVYDLASGDFVPVALPGGGSGGTVPDGGTTGQVLTKQSATDQDTDWEDAPSPAMVLIAEQTPSATGTVTFSSIPATYRDLVLVIRGRGDTAATTVNVLIQLNGDTTAGNYERQRAGATGTTATGSSASDNVIATMPAASATANVAGSAECIIYDYKGTTFQKEYGCRYGGRLGTALSAFNSQMLDGHWANAAAVNSVAAVLSAGNYVSGSVVSLYGRM